MDDNTLVGFGGEVKSLGDGKIGGYLVLFSDSTTPDLANDFFTKDTDFGASTSTLVWYDHLMNATVRHCLDVSGTLKKTDAGIWAEAQLNLRNEYEKEIHDLVLAGKLGWSSGTASHLVEREQVGKSHWIKRWPLGLDASLTPTPCEPRTSVVPLKSLVTGDKPEGKTLDEDVSNVRDAAEALAARMEDVKSMREAQGRRLSAKRMDELKPIIARLNAIIDYSTRPTEAEVLALRLRLAKL